MIGATWPLDPSGATPPACVADPQTMCLFNGRFTVRLSQRDPGGALTPALVTRRFNDGGGFGFLNPSQENLFIRVESRCSTSLNRCLWARVVRSYWA